MCEKRLAVRALMNGLLCGAPIDGGVFSKRLGPTMSEDLKERRENPRDAERGASEGRIAAAVRIVSSFTR